MVARGGKSRAGWALGKGGCSVEGGGAIMQLGEDTT